MEKKIKKIINKIQTDNDLEKIDNLYLPKIIKNGKSKSKNTNQ
jgi:hypothetical protein